MSRQGTDRDKLPLPSPGSPRELDEKILAHARANAPAGKRAGPLAWGGGLATASILVVAVYLTNLTGSNDPAAPARVPAAEEVSLQPENAPAAPAAMKMQARSRASDEASLAADYADTIEDLTAETEASEGHAAALPANHLKAEADTAAIEPLIRDRLEQFRAMLQRGQEEQARLEYAALRDSCDCKLPQTLEQALARFPATP